MASLASSSSQNAASPVVKDEENGDQTTAGGHEPLTLPSSSATQASSSAPVPSTSAATAVAAAGPGASSSGECSGSNVHSTEGDVDSKIADDEVCLCVIVKHAGKEYKIENLMQDHTIVHLKEQIYDSTNVRPERQKLFGLRSKDGKQHLSDDQQLDSTSIVSGMKIMMMGSQEKEIRGVEAAARQLPSARLEDDVDIGEDDTDANIPTEPDYLKKIARRVKYYKFNMLNMPRPGKKLLVLDIDYTLFDHRSVAQSAVELMRPFLHEFLTMAYINYDIVIWSATSMKFIEAKMKELRVANNPNYKIMFYLDSNAMISVFSRRYGQLNVKPLAVIWGKFPLNFNAENTIMFDDIRRNFLMNPQNGLKIRPFKEAHKNQATDQELFHLSKYLDMIAKLDKFSHLDHRNWKYYCSIETSKRHKSSR